jgi:hypothetical protein
MVAYFIVFSVGEKLIRLSDGSDLPCQRALGVDALLSANVRIRTNRSGHSQ